MMVIIVGLPIKKLSMFIIYRDMIPNNWFE